MSISNSECAHDNRDCNGEIEMLSPTSQSWNWIGNYQESLKDHEALCKATVKALNELLSEEQPLSDLTSDVSVEEIKAQISVLNGQAITIYIERESLRNLEVIVSSPNASVLELKKAVKRAYELEEIIKKRNSINKPKSSTKSANANISWRYIWRTYFLSNKNRLLTNDSQSLSSYGVGNKSTLLFVRKSKVHRFQQRT